MLRDINWNQKQIGISSPTWSDYKHYKTVKFLVVFFSVQQWPCHNNILADKGLNLFDECAADFVLLCPQEKECTSSSWGDSKMYTPGTIANSQTGCQLT